jgi:hypothetical protein
MSQTYRRRGREPMRPFACQPKLTQSFLIFSHSEPVTKKGNGVACHEFSGENLWIRQRNATKRAYVSLYYVADDSARLLVRRTYLRYGWVMDDQHEVVKGIILHPHDMCLLVEAYVREISSPAVPILTVEEGVKAIRPVRLPRLVFVHKLIIPLDIEPAFAESEVAHSSEVCDCSRGPNRVIVGFELTIRRESVQLKSALRHQGDPQFLPKGSPVDSLPNIRPSRGSVGLLGSTNNGPASRKGGPVDRCQYQRYSSLQGGAR